MQGNLVNEYWYGEQVERGMWPQSGYPEWEDMSCNPVSYDYESYDHPNYSWMSYEDQPHQPTKPTLEDTLNAFVKFSEENDRKALIREEKRTEECLHSFMISALEAQERNNERFDALEASIERVEFLIEQIANEVQRRQLEEQKAFEASIISEMVEEEEEDQRIEYVSEITMEDNSLSLLTSIQEPSKLLDTIESELPMAKSVRELQESFDSIVDMSVKNKNVGRIAPLKSYLSLPNDESYIIEFEYAHDSCYWVSMEDLEGFGAWIQGLLVEIQEYREAWSRYFPVQPGLGKRFKSQANDYKEALPGRQPRVG